MYIDTHTHLTDDRYNGEGDKIAEALNADGVKFIINIGYDAESSKKSVELAQRHKNVYAAVAVHPQDSQKIKETDYGDFIGYAKSDKLVAIGETGLDYHYEDSSPRIIQKEVFRQHLELAYTLKLPVIIHTRDACQDMYNILKESQNLLCYGALLHCFSESVEMAKEFVKLGLYISFGGAVTFKNARGLLDAVKYVPIDRILTETDCPYLTPEPFRGTLNYPKNVKYVADKIAELKGVSVEVLNENILKNTCNLFKRIKINE